MLLELLQDASCRLSLYYLDDERQPLRPVSVVYTEWHCADSLIYIVERFGARHIAQVAWAGAGSASRCLQWRFALRICLWMRMCT